MTTSSLKLRSPLIDLKDQNRGDSRGSLLFLESNKHLPFPFERVYFLYGTQPDVRRGFHAHKKLRQFAICTSGSCQILLEDGQSKETYALNTPTMGLLIEPMVWHEMYDFSKDCVLLVLASDRYSEEDYIRNKTEFLTLCGL
jgi:dTDP-4-dehydrorhamnose 3,5-epimerase-like enzyme